MAWQDGQNVGLPVLQDVSDKLEVLQGYTGQVRVGQLAQDSLSISELKVVAEQSSVEVGHVHFIGELDIEVSSACG